MRLILYTNYGIEGSIDRHVVKIQCTYYSINKEELYIYQKNKGFCMLDINKIFKIDIPYRGYYNHIELNDGIIVDILPKDTAKKDILKLMRWRFNQ